MRTILSLLFVTFLTLGAFAQPLPNLPIPLGAGTAEVWNNQIFYFGGSNNWAGSITYPRIYKFDGLQWSYHDSIPDYNLWDVESVLVGERVYLISGWPNGADYLRRYNLSTGQWDYLANSPNTQTWGVAAEHLNGIIYLFNSTGNAYAYSIANDSWSTLTPNTATGTWDLSSILYQNEIYIIGYNDSTFFKYTPAIDQWTQLANSPYQVGACAMGIINNLIYCIGGNSDGQPQADYKSVIVYNISTNTWAVDSLEISSKRHWMATAEYQGGLYILGGIDSTSNAVDIVEEIVPQGTSDLSHPPSKLIRYYSLEQNFPNPFNPITAIPFYLPRPQQVTLTLYGVTGKQIRTIFEGKLPSGEHRIRFNGANLSSGIYIYRLTTPYFRAQRKMILVK